MIFRYILKPGEYLHDTGESETLNAFTRRVCSMSVYGLFFDYATVISKDSKDLAIFSEQYKALNRYNDIRCVEQTRVKVPLVSLYFDEFILSVISFSHFP